VSSSTPYSYVFTKSVHDVVAKLQERIIQVIWSSFNKVQVESTPLSSKVLVQRTGTAGT
jgi:hypothetical protein